MDIDNFMNRVPESIFYRVINQEHILVILVSIQTLKSLHCDMINWIKCLVLFMELWVIWVCIDPVKYKL